MSTPDDEQREAEFEEWNERTAGGTKPTPQAPHISEVDEILDKWLKEYAFKRELSIELQEYIDHHTNTVLGQLEAQQIPVIALTHKKPHTEVQIQAIPVEAVREAIQAIRGRG